MSTAHTHMHTYIHTQMEEDETANMTLPALNSTWGGGKGIHLGWREMPCPLEKASFHTPHPTPIYQQLPMEGGAGH